MERTVLLLSLLSLVGLFVLFLRGPRTRLPTDPRAQKQLLPGIVFEFGRWTLTRFTPWFRYLRLTPNILSFLSLPASLFAAFLVATGHFHVGAVLLAFMFSLDAWDGALARELGTASEAGEIVDATMDRYTDVIVMLGFLYYYRADLVPWLIASAALTGTVAVSYTRAKGAAVGVDPEMGFMQRHERAVWLAGGSAIAPVVASLLEEPSSHPTYYVVVAALGVVAIGTNFTAVRRARFVVTMLTQRQASHLAHAQPSSGVLDEGLGT